MSQPHPAEDEVQFARVEVNVALPVDKDTDDSRRRGHFRTAVESVFNDQADIEFQSVRQVQLQYTETPEEAGERRLAEAEARAEAEAQARYERHLDNRRGW